MAGQSAQGVWDALYTALLTLFPPETGALVSQGDPGNYQPDLIVAVMGYKAPVTRPTIGPGRSREEILEVDVLCSAYVHGGPEAAGPAAAAAITAGERIKAWLRADPNQRLSGACYDAWVSSTELSGSLAWEYLDGVDAPVPAGRVGELALTVTAKIRT